MGDRSSWQSSFQHKLWSSEQRISKWIHSNLSVNKLGRRPSVSACNPANGGSAASLSKSQTREAGAGAKGKKLIQVLHDLGEWWAPVSRPSPLPVQAWGSPRVREGEGFSDPFIVLALGTLSVKNHPELLSWQMRQSFWCSDCLPPVIVLCFSVL